jgi:hypothetical protein
MKTRCAHHEDRSRSTRWALSIAASISVASSALLSDALAQPAGNAQSPPDATGVTTNINEDVVYLRGQAAGLRGEVIAADLSGLTLKRSSGSLPSGAGAIVKGDGATVLLSWERVREVEGPAALKAATFEEWSVQLLRIRGRLERGDIDGAAERAEQALRDLQQARANSAAAKLPTFGPSDLLVQEAALRIALERGSQAGAVRPWLEMFVGGIELGSWPSAMNLNSVVDQETGLCSALPPIFSTRGEQRSALAALAGEARLANVVKDGGPARAVARGYQLAMQAAAGRTIEEIKLRTELVGESKEDAVKIPSEVNEGSQLVIDMTLARFGDAGLRAEARARLKARLDRLERAEASSEYDASEVPADRSWQRAWIRAAMGHSLIAERDATRKRQGVLELLTVTASHRQMSPLLAEECLYQARMTLAGLGASKESLAAMDEELKRDFHRSVETQP